MQLCIAQSDSTNYDELSLQDLMNIKISVASIKELTPRESPGVVSYISAEDIRESGAIDLMDVLRMVPGFDFAVDVEGVVGLGVRGNWAHEGKVLMLIDGQEMNEGLYSSLQFGNHYPVESIKRIEIIRGPGSAIYGGNAEYAVINIITNDAKDISGIKATGVYSQTEKTFAQRGLNFEAGETFKDFSMSISAIGMQAKRSDKNYTDVFGSTYAMSDQSQLNNGFVNLKLGYKNLKIKAIADWYRTMERDEYQELLSKPVSLNFDSYLFEIKNEFNVNSKFKFIPRFNYKKQIPWRYTQTETDITDATPFDITNERYQATLLTTYDPAEQLNITSGAEIFTDVSTKKITNEFFSTTNSKTLHYNNAAFFAQALFKNRIANLTAGCRYNLNSLYPASFVPRFGITKAVGKVHAKALYSTAFRAPSTMNIDPAPTIKPENTTVIEVEVGWQVNNDMFISANVYDIKTKNVITYYYDTVVDFDGYKNFPESGTQGLEFVFKYKRPWGHVDFSGSFYSAHNQTTLANYNVPDNNNELLAFPSLKYNLSTGFNLSQRITWNLSSSLLSKRNAIASIDEDGAAVYTKLPVFCLVNTFVNFRDMGLRGLSLGFGIRNILNHEELYVQPYNSLHAPLPGFGRSYTIKLSYSLKK